MTGDRDETRRRAGGVLGERIADFAGLNRVADALAHGTFAEAEAALEAYAAGRIVQQAPATQARLTMPAGPACAPDTDAAYEEQDDAPPDPERTPSDER